MSVRDCLVLSAVAGAAVPVGRAGEVSEADAALFQSARPRLFGVAYRVLRSAPEAEDVVQETWFRWQRTDRGNLRDARAFLATATLRLAINVAQSARARHETHVGPWLVDQVDAGAAVQPARARREMQVGPWPVDEVDAAAGTWVADEVDAAADPSLDAERREALESAMRMLLQKLSPAERAAYVLREAFDYPYRRIAEVLRLSEANARQLATRARRRLSGEDRRPVGAREQRRLVEAFVAAAQTGDLATLEQLLAADVGACTSGGGLVRAERVSGGASVVRVAA
jgi:RNA polymerase sigma-70 factor, ECF subfamily